MDNRKRDVQISSPPQLVSLSVIALLSLAVVLLILQNRTLKHALSTRTPLSGVEELQTGDRVKPFVIHMLHGESKTVSYSDSTQRYLLFVLSTNCPHCEKNLAVWNTLVHAAIRPCTILGISVDGLDNTTKYAETKNLSFLLTALPDTTFIRQYRIGAVPQTILISSPGVVEKTWVGELNSVDAIQIQDALNAPASVSF